MTDPLFLATPGDGEWLALADGARAALVRAGEGRDAVALWRALARGADALLDELAQDGLSRVPALALVELLGDRTRVIVRGAATVEVDHAAGRAELAGRDVATWAEQLLPAAETLVLRADDAVAGEGLPLASGAVRASALRLAGTAAVDEPAASRRPAASAPDPAPEPPSAPAAPVPLPPEPAAVAPVPAPAEVAGALPEQTLLEPPDELATDPVEPAEPEDEPANSYAHLFEATVVRPVEFAAVRPAEEAEEAPAAEQADGDHDGETVLAGDIARLRAGTGPAPAAAPAPPEPPAPWVELSTGPREQLTQPVLIGRAPSVSKVSGGAIPRLVTISGDDDISRNHVQIALEGGTVVVTDLHSRNGTSVVLPGKAPQRLRPGEPTAVIAGTVVDLGSGVTATIREEP